MTTTNADAGRIARPAGFWRRMLAGLFDILLLLTIGAALLWEVSLVVSLVGSYGWTASESQDTEVLLWTILGPLWLVVSTLLLPILYYTLTEGAFGRTLGKALFRIRVVADDGRPISYGRAFARLITLPYAVLPAGLGLLWAALPPAKRAWHDYISATHVIITE